ncbi:hypothetical protein [Deferrisoma sp.]
MDPNTLETELRALREKVEALELRVARLEGAAPQRPAEPREPAPVPDAVGEGEGRLGGTLQRAALVCFVLAVALVLRTATEAGWVAGRAGAWIGVAYAVCVAAAAGWAGAKGKKGAGTFLAAGAVTGSAAVFESVTRLGVMTSNEAFVASSFLALAVGAAGRLGQLAAGVGVGLVAVLGAVWLLPRPPDGRMLLVAASAATWAAAHLAEPVGGRWLRAPGLLGVAAAGALAGEADGRGAFWAAAGLGLIPLAAALADRARGKTRAWVALELATGVGAAYVLARLAGAGAPGAAWVGGAGVIFLLGAAVDPVFARSVAPAGGLAAGLGAGALLPGWWGPALGMAGALVALDRSDRCREASLRVAAYLLAVVPVMLVLLGGTARGPGQALGAAVAAGLGWAVHRRCRRTPPPSGSIYFDRIDRSDDTASIVLLSALGAAFFSARILARWIWPGAGAGALAAADTVLLSVAAALLWIGGTRRRDKELRAVGGLVYLAAGAKVFVYDLFWVGGFSLVVSVLVYGVSAAAGGFLAGRSRGPDAKGGRDA